MGGDRYEDLNMQQHTTITEATFIGAAELIPRRKRRGRPMHKMLVSFSAAYFTGALVTDLVYWQMPDVLWERFSIWLIAAVLLALTNAFVHSRDGYTAVVPTGLMLSALVIVVLLLTAGVSMALANRHRIGG
jgi:uncharacterized membrane protein